MRAKRFKRKIYKNIPVIFFSVILTFVFIFTIFFLSTFIISKQIFFLSPLAKVNSSKNSNIENSLRRNNIQFTKVEGSTILLKDQGVVYLDLSKNLDSQISSLQLILQRLTIEGKKFKKLDLRFDKPVIEI